MFVGIDGGGTHSLAVGIDSNGVVLARASAGSLNFFGSGLTAARQNLRQLVAGLVRPRRGAVPMVRGVVGSAALFSDATPRQKSALCRGILPLSRIRVVSDCQTACFGALLGAPGVLTIAGTGSIVLACNEHGRSVRVGGWGHLLGDEGSGWWIALEAMKAAIAAEEGLGPKTVLGAPIRRWLRVKRLSDVVPKIYRSDLAKEKLASLAGYVAKQPESRDAMFRAICRQAGRELAAQALAAAALARVSARPLPICLGGSVLTKNASVRTSFIRELRTRVQVRIVMPQLTPELGAAAMALLDGRVRLTPEIVANLAKSRRAA